MELPASTLVCFLKENYCWTDVPTELLMFFFHIIFLILVRKLSHIRGQLTTISFRIFYFFWLACLAAASVSLFLPFIAHYRAALLPVRVEGDVKNVMIHWALTSFAAVTVSSEGGRTKTWEEKLESGAAFSQPDLFLWERLSRWIWVGRAAVNVSTLSLHSCLTVAVAQCVCALGNACLSLWTNKLKIKTSGKLWLVDCCFDTTVLLVSRSL